MEYLQSEEIENNETLEKARMLIVKYTTKHLMSLKLEYKDLINNNDFKIMYEEGPPYDDGPFGVFDSLKINFEDLKILTYIPLESKSECIDSIKNPFCPYSNYICSNNICTFEIDSVEYQKAK